MGGKATQHVHACTCMFMALCVLFVWVAFLSFILLRELVCYTHVHVHVVPCNTTELLSSHKKAADSTHSRQSSYMELEKLYSNRRGLNSSHMSRCVHVQYVLYGTCLSEVRQIKRTCIHVYTSLQVLVLGFDGDTVSLQ